MDKQASTQQTRLMTPYNRAQQLLMFIGGTAALVAGEGGHYWADVATPKKSRQRAGRKGPGTYGKGIIHAFEGQRRDLCK